MHTTSDIQQITDRLLGVARIDDMRNPEVAEDVIRLTAPNGDTTDYPYLGSSERRDQWRNARRVAQHFKCRVVDTCGYDGKL